MIALLHCRHFSVCSRYADRPLARIELSLPASRYSNEDCPRARAAIETLGLDWPDDRVDPAAEQVRPEAMALAALVLAILHAAGHSLASALVEAEQDGSAGVQVFTEDGGSVEKAAALAIRILSAALAGRSLASLQAPLDALLAELRTRMIDPNALLLVQAARARGLPVMWLDQFPFEEELEGRSRQMGLYKLGQGAAGRILSGALPQPEDPGKLEGLAHRGRLMQQLLAGGFPVPAFLSERSIVRSATRAMRTASRLAGPSRLCSLVRPALAYRLARPMATGPLTDDEQIKSAFYRVAGRAEEAWMESIAAGHNYRFLVIGGRVRAVAEWASPEAAGGGQDVTERVSAEILELAESLAGHFGLNELAGIDLAVVDLQGAAGSDNCTVLDVLPDPDLLNHARQPTIDEGLSSLFQDAGLQKIADALLDTLFPPGQNGRIPLIAVTGTNGKTTTVRMIEAILRERYQHVACTTSEGARIGQNLIHDGDSAGISAAMLLSESQPDAAVLETARGGLIAHGIAFDRCDVGVCLNIGEDHLGMDGVETLAQLAEVKGEVIRRAAGAAVLNADDERVMAMRADTSAAEIVLVSQRADNPVIAAHLEQGGRAIVLEHTGADGQIVDCSGSRRELIMAVADIPATHGGAVAFNVENACFAIAATRAIGISADSVRVALAQFDSSHDCNPGRFNLFDGLHCQVLIDHAQNVPAMQKLGQAVAAMPCRGHRWLLLRALGNRSDREIRALAEAAAGHFDRYHCTNFDRLRGREPGEVPELLEKALQAAGVAPNALVSLADEDQALENLLANAGPEDLVVMLYLGDGHRRIWDRLERMAADQRSGARASGPRVGHA